MISARLTVLGRPLVAHIGLRSLAGAHRSCRGSPTVATILLPINGRVVPPTCRPQLPCHGAMRQVAVSVETVCETLGRSVRETCAPSNQQSAQELITLLDRYPRCLPPGSESPLQGQLPTQPNENLSLVTAPVPYSSRKQRSKAHARAVMNHLVGH